MKTDEADEKRKDAELLMLFFVDSDDLHLHRFVSRVSIVPGFIHMIFASQSTQFWVGLFHVEFWPKRFRKS